MWETRERERSIERERMEEKVVEREVLVKNEVWVFKTRIYSGFSFFKKSFILEVSSHTFDFKARSSL